MVTSRGRPLSLGRALAALTCPWLRDRPAGLLYPEATAYIGVVPLLGLAFLPMTWWWLVALGLFGLTVGWWRLWPDHPARTLYWLSLVLTLIVGMGWNGHLLRTSKWTLLCCLHVWDLGTNAASVLPMRPYVQPWQFPSTVDAHPVGRWLTGKSGRVSGLPYPLQTGWWHGVQTLGNAGSLSVRAVAEVDRPWALDALWLGECSPDLRFAYTYRVLRAPWRATPVRHLYEREIT